MNIRLTALFTILLHISAVFTLAPAQDAKPAREHSAKGNATANNKPASPLSGILNPDGTVRADKSGSFDPRGWRMELTSAGAPRFTDAARPAAPNAPTITGANNRVLALAVDSSGNVYIGGLFTEINGISANRVAKWNGTNWSALGSGTGLTGNGVGLTGGQFGNVSDLATDGNNLYVGGSFNKASNSSSSIIDANNVALWNGSSWAALGNGTGSTGNGVSGYVEALVFSGNRLYVGGQFYDAYNDVGNRVGVNNIAAWDGTAWRLLGNLQTNFGNGVNNVVYDLAASGGNVYVGGTFSAVLNNNVVTPANRVAVWNGSGWAALGSGLNGDVAALLAHNGNIYAGGNFSTNGNNVVVNNIAVWNGTAWNPLGNGLSREVNTLSGAGNNIYVGGHFDRANNSAASSVQANKVAVWNGSSWAALGNGVTATGNGVDGWVEAVLALPGNKTYVGGEFFKVYQADNNFAPVYHLALWDNGAWAAPGAPPTLNINDVTLPEGNSGVTNFTFTVTLFPASAQPVTVTYATGGGTATPGNDYQALGNTTLTFNPGETSKTVTVPVIGDAIYEPNETFFVNLSNAVGAPIDDPQGQGIIQNDDPLPGTVAFSFSGSGLSEGAGAVTISVARTFNTAGAASVDYTTTNDTTFAACGATGNAASSRCDFTATSGTLYFAAGEASKTFSVPIIDDYRVENAESFTLTLRNPVNATLGTQTTTTITINDNDTAGGGDKVYVSRLGGSETVPASASGAAGTGSVTLNDAETQAAFALNFNGLSGAATAMHIHGPASVMHNGPVLFTLNGATPLDLTPEQVQQLKAGLLYFDVHTANFPDGEIRGQLASQPLENAKFFVRQHYYDFLSRQPDTAGLNYWVGQIANVCGADAACTRQRRLEVSAAFFVELEFQQTGAYVYRLYRAAFGNTQPFPNPENHPDAAKMPGHQAFLSDRARVVGGVNLAQSQLALANDFVTRTEFFNRYPASLTGAQLVDALLNTIQAATGVSLAAQRDALIALHDSGGRGAVLYRLADDNATANPINNRAFIDAEYNRAFVLMQYFGYLRRDPDLSGFNFWLNAVSNRPGLSLQTTAGQQAMVCNFLTAQEYQERFSNARTRTTGECPAP